MGCGGTSKGETVIALAVAASWTKPAAEPPDARLATSSTHLSALASRGRVSLDHMTRFFEQACEQPLHMRAHTSKIKNNICDTLPSATETEIHGGEKRDLPLRAAAPNHHGVVHIWCRTYRHRAP